MINVDEIRISGLKSLFCPSVHRNQRLRDLQGLRLRVATEVSKPYILDMIPNDEIGYQIDGLFAEIFHSLQVCTLTICTSKSIRSFSKLSIHIRDF